MKTKILTNKIRPKRRNKSRNKLALLDREANRLTQRIIDIQALEPRLLLYHEYFQERRYQRPYRENNFDPRYDLIL